MCIESQTQVQTQSPDIAKRGFRSLKELSRNFKQREEQREVTDAGACKAEAASEDEVQAAPLLPDQHRCQGSCAGTLMKLFEGKGFGFISPDDKSGDVFLHFKDIANSSPEDMVVGMRVTFSHDVDRRSGKKRAKNAVIIGMAAPGTVRSCLQSGQPVDRAENPHQLVETDEISKSSTEVDSSAVTESPVAMPENPLACYDRAELLAVFSSLRKASAASAVTCPGIRTLYMPRTKAKVVPARKATTASLYEEDPNLDDMQCLVKMEARLSRESGADAKNDETFGECEGGWTFDNAVEANAKLPLCRFSFKGDLAVDTSTAASDGTSSEHGSLTGDGLEPSNEPLSPLSFMLSNVHPSAVSGAALPKPVRPIWSQLVLSPSRQPSASASASGSFQ